MRTDSDGVELVSGEAVHLDVRLARAGSRVLALMIDALVQVMLFVVVILVSTVMLGMSGVLDGGLFNAAIVVTMVLVFVGYPTLAHGLSRGRSIGKLVFGLRVVRDDGGPIAMRHAFIRALVGATLEWPGVLLPASWLISLGTLLGSRSSKRLADLATGTIVIHERTPESWGWVPVVPRPLAAWATNLELTGMDDQLALAARHFLSRARRLREPYRSRMGEGLAREIMGVVTPPPPPGTAGWAYLAAVVGERHRRAAQRLTRDRIAQARLWPELFPTAPVYAAPPAPPAYPQAAPPAGAAPAGAPGPQLRPAQYR